MAGRYGKEKMDDAKFKKYFEEHNSNIYIPLEKCKDRFLYRIHSRNLEFGVYSEREKGFIGIRQKFGSEYLFTEYHWDTGAPCGTVKPQEELYLIPEDLILNESLGTKDQTTGRLIEFDKPIKDGGRGWYYLDAKDELIKDNINIRPVTIHNDDLFNFLKQIEDSYK